MTKDANIFEDLFECRDWLLTRLSDQSRELYHYVSGLDHGEERLWMEALINKFYAQYKRLEEAETVGELTCWANSNAQGFHLAPLIDPKIRRKFICRNKTKTFYHQANFDDRGLECLLFGATIADLTQLDKTAKPRNFFNYLGMKMDSIVLEDSQLTVSPAGSCLDKRLEIFRILTPMIKDRKNLTHLVRLANISGANNRTALDELAYLLYSQSNVLYSRPDVLYSQSNASPRKTYNWGAEIILAIKELLLMNKTDIKEASNAQPLDIEGNNSAHFLMQEDTSPSTWKLLEHSLGLITPNFLGIYPLDLIPELKQYGLRDFLLTTIQVIYDHRKRG